MISNESFDIISKFNYQTHPLIVNIQIENNFFELKKNEILYNFLIFDTQKTHHKFIDSITFNKKKYIINIINKIIIT